MAFVWTKDTGGTLSTGLVGAYNLEADGTDNSVTGANLTNHGSPTFPAAKNGNGMSQGTSNTTIWLETSNALGIDGGAISMSCWVKINTAQSGGTQGQLSFQCNTSSEVDNRITYWDNGGTPTLRYLRNRIGTGTDTLDTANTLSTSAFTHLVYTYDGTNIEGWVNGVSKGTKLASGSGSAGETSGFAIGGQTGGAAVELSSAVIDAAYVWNKKLTNTEVADLFNSGTGSFYLSSGAVVGSTLQMMGV